jgi:hypothetical protein
MGVVSYTPRPLYPRERATGTNWIGGWAGPRTGLDDVKKKPRPYRDSNSDPPAIQPVTSSYTDCTTLVPTIH